MNYDYRLFAECPMCGARTGQACTVLSNYDGTYKPGDTRPQPHFYRETLKQRAVYAEGAGR